MTATLTRITGTLAEARPLRDASLYELVRVGSQGLLGEVIRFTGDTATLQIFEDTTGLAVGAPVTATGAALTAELGPGLLGQVLDGVGRPLAALAGDFIAAGATAPTLDRTRRWSFAPRAAGHVERGAVLGTVREYQLEHAILAPRAGVAELRAGAFTVDEPIGALAGEPVFLAQRWPIRTPRPVARRLATDRPLVTGQRVFDLLFPLAEGGTIAVPGGFGTGKTVVEHSLAKYADADVVVFVGCGERGNEMAELLESFPRLVDPRTGRSIMERTVMIVNTSNMPVVAREASVYLGITIAEYYRDMGLRVAVMVDSLSRWAEALRDIAARLQEMPGEEGYPTSMASRLGALYERAGRATTLAGITGAVTLVCAVSPPGGDFSEPVTQASLRVAGGLWALDAQLARARQFPAVDWATSYSLYPDASGGLRTQVIALLQRDAELREIASLVGIEEMEDRDRLVLAIAALVREHVLGQNAYDPNDAMSPPDKTTTLAELALAARATADTALAAGAELDSLPLAELRRAFAEVRRAPPEERAARIADCERAIGGLR